MLHTQTRCRSVHVRGVTAGQTILESQHWARSLHQLRAEKSNEKKANNC